jgi:hypothetical protein
MYRRDVLESTGSFNPYIHSDEEPELCLRIKHAGHRIATLDAPAVLHFTDRRTFAGLFARRRRGLYLGQGEIIRLLLHDPLLYSYLRQRGYVVAPLAALAVMAGAVAVSARRRNGTVLGLSAAAAGAFVVAHAVKNRSAHRTAYSLLHRLFIVEGAVRGFVAAPRDPRTYDVSVSLIE